MDDQRQMIEKKNKGEKIIKRDEASQKKLQNTGPCETYIYVRL